MKDKRLGYLCKNYRNAGFTEEIHVTCQVSIVIVIGHSTIDELAQPLSKKVELSIGRVVSTLKLVNSFILLLSLWQNEPHHNSTTRNRFTSIVMVVCKGVKRLKDSTRLVLCYSFPLAGNLCELIIDRKKHQQHR